MINISVHRQYRFRKELFVKVIVLMAVQSYSWGTT